MASLTWKLRTFYQNRPLKQDMFNIFEKNWISDQVFQKSFPGTINTLFFSNQYVEIKFFVDFQTIFAKSQFLYCPSYENFCPFSTTFENYLKTFSCRFGALEVNFGFISWNNPTIFSELPIEICQFMEFLKKVEFQIEYS